MTPIRVAVVLARVPLGVSSASGVSIPENLLLPSYEHGLRHRGACLTVEKHPDSGVFLTEVVCVLKGGTGLPSTGRPF